MGDAENHGIARGMSWLTGNASNPYFLFLERDFQLIEPATCVVEQVNSGVELLEKQTAHGEYERSYSIVMVLEHPRTAWLQMK